MLFSEMIASQTSTPNSETESTSSLALDSPPRDAYTHTQIPSELVKVAASTPELFIDAEGISLSRTDELSILKLYIDAKTHKHTYLINAHILGIKAFTTKSTNSSHTLKSIRKDTQVTKVF